MPFARQTAVSSVSEESPSDAVEPLYNQSFSVFSDWYPLSSNPIIKKTTEWINGNVLFIQDNEPIIINIDPQQRIPQNEVNSNASAPPKQLQSSTTNNAFTVVIIALMLGALVSVLLVLFYIEFTSSSNSSKQSTHTETTRNENFDTKHEDTAFTEEKIHDDFDYPYEDIGKVTGI